MNHLYRNAAAEHVGHVHELVAGGIDASPPHCLVELASHLGIGHVDDAASPVVLLLVERSLVGEELGRQVNGVPHQIVGIRAAHGRPLLVPQLDQVVADFVVVLGHECDGGRRHRRCRRSRSAARRIHIAVVATAPNAANGAC